MINLIKIVCKSRIIPNDNGWESIMKIIESVKLAVAIKIISENSLLKY